jgi:glycosyltransferase involved in cell wall biosynthesis
MAGGNDHRKGFDLLLEALSSLNANADLDMLCVVFGQLAPRDPPAIPYETRWLGHVSDDPTLVLLYGAADLLVLPSRQENLPQAATEAQACGCPVVAFRTTGIPDAVEHGVTGHLATPFDTAELTGALHRLLIDEALRARTSAAARERAVSQWSYPVVAARVLALYEQVRQASRGPAALPVR